MATKPTVQTVTAQAANNAFQVNKAVDQLATAFEGVLANDGTDTMTGNLNMGTSEIYNVGAPTLNTSAARLQDISDADATGAATAQLRIDLAAGDVPVILKNTNYKRVSEYTNNSLNLAATDIGSTITTLIIDDTPTITDTLLLDENISLVWYANCILEGDYVVSIQGSIMAGVYQLFGQTVGVTPAVSLGPDIGSIYVEWWGGGVNVTTTVNQRAFELALATGSTPVIQLLKGTYPIAKEDPANGCIYTGGTTALQIKGLGKNVTTIQNNSTTGGGIKLSTDSCALSDLTFKNGTSTGFGILGAASNCIFTNLRIQDHTGASTWAFNIDGGTASKIQNLQINLNITNGFKLGGTKPTNNVQVDNLQLDICSGTQVYLDRVSATTMSRVQLDEGGGTNSIYMTGCNQLSMPGFTAEYTDEIALTGNAFIEIDNCDSVTMTEFRINHLGGTASKNIFRTEPTTTVSNNIVIQNGEYQTDQVGMTFFYSNGNDYGICVENIRNLSSIASVGLHQAGACNYTKLSNWVDMNTIATHTLDSLDLLVDNVRGAMAVTDRDNQTFINCTGLITGTAERTITRIPPYVQTITEAGSTQAQGIVNIDTTLGAMAVTVVDGGKIGATLTITMTVDGGDATVGVASHDTTASFTFADVGDTLTLIWNGINWNTLASYGV